MRTDIRQAVTGLVAVLLVLSVAGAGCRRRIDVPPADTAPARGTLSGTVRGPNGVAPVEGRHVEAVEVESGDRYSTETNAVGGFSLLVPPGRYRLEVALAEGESVVRDPGVVSVDSSELARDKDVILAGAGVVKDP